MNKKLYDILKPYVSERALKETELIMYNEDIDEETIIYLKNKHKRKYAHKKEMGYTGMASYIEDKKPVIIYNYGEHMDTVDEFFWEISELGFYDVVSDMYYDEDNTDEKYFKDYLHSMEFIRIVLHEFRHIDMQMIDKAFHNFNCEWNVEKYAQMCLKEMIRNKVRFVKDYREYL